MVYVGVGYEEIVDVGRRNPVTGKNLCSVLGDCWFHDSCHGLLNGW